MYLIPIKNIFGDPNVLYGERYGIDWVYVGEFIKVMWMDNPHEPKKTISGENKLINIQTGKPPKE